VKKTRRLEKTNSMHEVDIPSEGHLWGYLFSTFHADIEKQMHIHTTGILTGVEKGILIIRTEVGAWVLPPKTVAYIPPRVLHSTEMIKGYSGWIVSIPRNREITSYNGPFVLEASDLLLASVRRIISFDLKSGVSQKQNNIIKVFFDELKTAREAQFLKIAIPKHAGLSKVAKFVLSQPEDMSSVETMAQE
jgi:hypothetical protein